MDFLLRYLIVLGWAVVVSIIMAVAYGISIWIFDKMLSEVKSLRHLTKKPIAISIVLAAFILAVAMIVVAVCK